jgi:hypothetical protein
MASAKEPEFAGKWLWSSGDDRFSLTLKQSGSTLTGYHTAIRGGGAKRDEVATGLLPSITGNVSGPIVIVHFRSGAPGSEAYGHARLTLRDRYLYWQLIDATGEHYLPENAVLIRQER